MCLQGISKVVLEATVLRYLGGGGVCYNEVNVDLARAGKSLF